MSGDFKKGWAPVRDSKSHSGTDHYWVDGTRTACGITSQPLWATASKAPIDGCKRCRGSSARKGGAQ